jgi:hypothetical protein
MLLFYNAYKIPHKSFIFFKIYYNTFQGLTLRGTVTPTSEVQKAAMLEFMVGHDDTISLSFLIK